MVSYCRQVLLSGGVVQADVSNYCRHLPESFDHDDNGNTGCDKNWIRLQKGGVSGSSNPKIRLASPDRAEAPLRSKASGHCPGFRLKYRGSGAGPR